MLKMCAWILPECHGNDEVHPMQAAGIPERLGQLCLHVVSNWSIHYQFQLGSLPKLLWRKIWNWTGETM
jgi:hypothetical protein